MFGQENINDRLGWHHVMMSVAPWPLILLSLSDLWRRKPMLTRDLEDALYTKTAYSITEILASLPASAGVFLAFTVPAYLLTGWLLYFKQLDQKHCCPVKLLISLWMTLPLFD